MVTRHFRDTLRWLTNAHLMTPASPIRSNPCWLSNASNFRLPLIGPAFLLRSKHQMTNQGLDTPLDLIGSVLIGISYLVGFRRYDITTSRFYDFTRPILATTSIIPDTSVMMSNDLHRSGLFYTRMTNDSNDLFLWSHRLLLTRVCS